MNHAPQRLSSLPSDTGSFEVGFTFVQIIYRYKQICEPLDWWSYVFKVAWIGRSLWDCVQTGCDLYKAFGQAQGLSQCDVLVWGLTA
jgi:hypothetical protein